MSRVQIYRLLIVNQKGFRGELVYISNKTTDVFLNISNIFFGNTMNKNYSPLSIALNNYPWAQMSSPSELIIKFMSHPDK